MCPADSAPQRKLAALQVLHGHVRLRPPHRTGHGGAGAVHRLQKGHLEAGGREGTGHTGGFKLQFLQGLQLWLLGARFIGPWVGGMRRESCPGAWRRSTATPAFFFIYCGHEPVLLTPHPVTTLKLFFPANGIQSSCPTPANSRSMIFMWFSVVSCDRQLIKWRIQCFSAGGCRPGLLETPVGGGGYPVDPQGGEQRAFLPCRWKPLQPLSSKLGWLDRCPICPLVGLEAVGQLLCPLPLHESPGPRPAPSLLGLRRSDHAVLLFRLCLASGQARGAGVGI